MVSGRPRSSGRAGRATASPEAPTRALSSGARTAASALAPRYAKSWAVVVGINRYRAEGIRDLDHAVSDALGMAQRLVTQLAFPREQVLLALEPWPEADVPWGVRAGDATKAVIESMLFTRLPELAGANDRVLIFFAGHGERRHLPDGTSQAGYLLPCDAEPGQWHTCVDLEAVTRAGNLCAAKHVFYLLDACYSGLATARAEVRERRYEETMLTTRARQVLTAGTARQAVADQGPQGHSLFTWYVLQGLAGGANLFNQGVITGSQLMVYVRDQVARAFGSAQMPDFGVLLGHESGGDFVFVEPQFGAADHLALGHALVGVARWLGDPGRLRAEARQFQAAIELGDGTTASAAWRALGDAQLALGDTRAAAAALRQARTLGDIAAALPLAMAHAGAGEMAAATEALEEFAAELPDHLDTPWARECARQWRRTGGARRRAVLIGSAQSSSTDMQDLRELLVSRFGFCPRDVRLVDGKHATRDRILQALEQLVVNASPADEVLVFFGGTGTTIPTSDNYVTRDGMQSVFMGADFRKQLLREETIVEVLARVSARDKLLIADVPHFALEPARARQIGWRFIGACSRKGLSFDKWIAGRMRGVFTYQLMRTLAEAGPGGLQQRTWVDAVQAAMHADGFRDAKPVSIGRGSHPIWPPVLSPDPAWLHQLSMAVNWDSVENDALEVWESMLACDAPPAPVRSALALARALVQRGYQDRAVEAIEFALQHGLTDDFDTRVLQLRVLARAGRPTKAREALEEWARGATRDASSGGDSGSTANQVPTGTTAADRQALRAACEPLIELLVQDERRALLVGVGHGQPGGPEAVPGVAKDLAAMQRLLIERLGLRAEAIVTVTDANATRSTVLHAFTQLVEQAQRAACFFYFSGPGSVDSDGEPVLRLADADEADIALTEFAQLAAPVSENLVTLVDAGFTVDTGDPRHAEPRPTEGLLFWDFDTQIRREQLERYRIGRFSIFPASLHFTKRGIAPKFPPGRAGRASRKRKLRRVTQEFLEIMGDQSGAPLVGLWVLHDSLTGAGHVALGTRSQYPLFRNRVVLGRLYATLDRWAQAPLRDAVRLLERFRHAGGGDDGTLMLELGLARLALGEHAAADTLLADAIERLEPGTERADARCHLARRLLLAGQPGAAATHLEAAIADDPDRADAHYQLGHALQQLIDQDLRRRIEGHWRTYLDLGAPGEYRAKVQDFLAKRAPST